MGRSPSCHEVGVKKGPWTMEEDQKLVEYIQKHGHRSWMNLPKSAGLNRCGKSCRLRWTNYLRPDIKRGKFSEEEGRLIIHLHSVLGNKWSAIATHLSGRTDNEIKNYWNTHLKKKLLLMGIDPVTHCQRTDLDLLRDLPALLAAGNFNLATPWDRQLGLQADAAKLATFKIIQSLDQVMNTTSGPSSTFDPVSLLPSTSLPNYQYNDLIQLSRRLGALMNGPNNHQGFYEQEKVSQFNSPCSNGGDTNQMINSYSLAVNGSSTPSLVSAASPEINDIACDHSKREVVNSNDISGDSSISTQVNAWEGLGTDLRWKDILDQLSRDGCL